MPNPPRDFALLKDEFKRQQQLYDECLVELPALSRLGRLLAQPWLAEIALQIVQLQRMIEQLEDSNGGPPGRLDAAWKRLEEIIAALSPAARPEAEQPAGAERRKPAVGPVARVAARLKLVMAFLFLQVAAAVGVLVWVLLTFGRSDPQTTLTGEQWGERAAARAEVGHVRLLAEEWARTAPPRPDSARAHADTSARDTTVADVYPGPEPERLRASVEALVVALSDLRLAERDLKMANRYLDNVLVLLDDSDLAAAAKQLAALEGALGGSPDDAPPSPIRIIVLGSLLGMLIITTHLNWKFRNRWETVGFLPWYVTRLIAAPVLSLAALGLLFQISFTTDLTGDTEISSLGLRGASPLTIFAVAVISGLFSNRVYDWLRRRVEATASPRPPRPGATLPPSPAEPNPEGESTP